MAEFMPLHGSRRNVDYVHVALHQIVGKTVEAIEEGSVASNYDSEPCLMLYFTNQTKHGFVLPRSD